MTRPMPAFAFALATLLAAPSLASPVHWTYEGAEGPAHWAELDKDFAACGLGQQQSPIDLTDGVQADLPPLQPHWSASAEWTVTNNGHTVQASAKDAGTLTIDGVSYDLLQFHFHHPSEHLVNGKPAPMEVHFVHRAANGSLAVVGVMLVGGGQPGPLDTLLAAAPATAGEAPAGHLDPNALMPKEGGYWRYAGSLTTPPCSEVVSWTVMHSPVQVSDAAIAAFSKLIPENARPVQQLHRRYLLSN